MFKNIWTFWIFSRFFDCTILYGFLASNIKLFCWTVRYLLLLLAWYEFANAGSLDPWCCCWWDWWSSGIVLIKESINFISSTTSKSGSKWSWGFKGVKSVTEGGEHEDELASKQPPFGLEVAPFRLFVGERVTSSRSDGNAPAPHHWEVEPTSWPPCCWSRLKWINYDISIEKVTRIFSVRES